MLLLTLFIIAELPRMLTREEMIEHKIPLYARDRCAALLIPLNKCRLASAYMPWKCSHERHTYEKCQYDEYMERVAEQKAINDAAAKKK